MSTANLQQAMDRAVQHHSAGRLAEAEEIYRQILAQQPNHPDALHMLGMLAHQVGKNEVAVELIGKAISVNPRVADYYCNLGLALSALDRSADSITALRSALQLNPRLAQAHNNLAIALWRSGQPRQAINAWREAIRLNPNMPEAYNSLGSAYQQQGQIDQAITVLQRAIELNPQLADAHNNLGIALKQQGQLTEAISAFRRAMELDPRRAEFHNNLGTALWIVGHVNEAATEFRVATQIQPSEATFQNNLGSALWARGQLDRAAEVIRTALKMNPSLAEAHGNLGNTLKDLGLLDEAIESYRHAVALKPDDPSIHSNLIYLLHFRPQYDIASIKKELEIWNVRHADPLKKLIVPHSNSRDPRRRLRVGYVSPDFREHAVGRFFLPLIEHHDHERFEIFCYADIVSPDELTERIKAAADKWVPVTGLPDRAVAEIIRKDQIDILVDLAAHTPGNRLLVLAQKPAPVQVTYLSYPSTTGLDTIDYRFTDPFLDPPGEANPLYSEESIRLQTYWCYESGIAVPPVNSLPAATNGYVTFGCLNTFRKVTKESLLGWCRIMRDLPHPRIVLHADDGSHRQRVAELFSSQQIDPSRVSFVGRVTLAEYFKLYQQIDIGLDPFPYTGGTTTCDALWMGVPVITLAGQMAVHRGGVSILSQVGLPELIASSTDEYVTIATNLARDISKLSTLRASLRQQMATSALMGAPRFAQNIEKVYREIWQRWCSRDAMT